MIKAIFLDFNGVIEIQSDSNSIQKWEAKLGLEKGELIKAIWWTQACKDCNEGKITADEMWNITTKDFDLSVIERQQLQKDFDSQFVINNELLEFVINLKPEIKLGIITNAGIENREQLNSYDFIKFFDSIIISGEESVAKPDAEIYMRACKSLNISPNEAIFIDDYLPNIEGANKLGMYGIHFVRNDFVIAEIKNIGNIKNSVI